MSAVELLHNAATQIEKGLEDEPAARTEMRVVVAQRPRQPGRDEGGRSRCSTARSARCARAPANRDARARPCTSRPGRSSAPATSRPRARLAQEALGLLIAASAEGAAEARIRVRTTLLRIANVQRAATRKPSRSARATWRSAARLLGP